MLIFCFVLTFILSLIFTPIIMKMATKYGVMDRPNDRKVHRKELPLLGGLAVYFSFLVAALIIEPVHRVHLAVMLGGVIIVLVGVIDDLYNIKPATKFFAQIAAATIVIFLGDMQVTFINLPLGGILEFGMMSIPITYLWITGVTNAMNLIDGLDGLSAGVSGIALIAVAGMAYIMGDFYVLTISILLIGSILGFLPYNFYPAKIFMGDTGALFLGYMISVLSLLGFKNITFISFIVPILILGVPISDTLFAIVRRLVNKKPISAPDKSHLHHCLLNLGFTHRQTVIIIYSISALFALFAFIFSMTTVWGSVFLIFIILLSLELMIEKIGLVSNSYKPLLKLFDNLRIKVRGSRDR